MRISHSTAVRAAFAVALTILCLISLYSFLSTRLLIHTANQVSDSQAVLEKLDELLTEVLEVESAARGYTLAGQEYYLEPYYAAVDKVGRTRRDLQTLTGGSPALQSKIPQLSVLVHEKLAHAAEMISQRKNNGLEGAQQLYRSGKGHQLMDTIRDQIAAMESEEQALLLREERNSHREANLATLALVAGSVLSIFILSSVFQYLNREIAQRRRSEATVTRLNRLYLVLSEVGQAIVHTRDPGALFHEVCRITVEHGLLQMAWVGIPDEESGILRPVAHWGNEDGYLNTASVISGDLVGMTGTGRYPMPASRFICNDIAADLRLLQGREEALKRGYLSAGTFPLRVRGNSIGIFVVYAPEVGYFDEERVALLDQVSRNLSFALESMEQDARRLEAEAVQRQQAMIIDQVHDSVVSTNLEGYVTSWNAGAFRATGYSSSEAIGRHISFLYSEGEHGLLQHGIIEPVKTMGRHEVEVQVRRKSGEIFLSRVSLSLLHDDRGTPVGMIGYSTDITEVKRTVDALRESEQRFRQMAENIEEMFWITNADLSEMLYVSPAYEKIWGRPVNSLYDNPKSFLDAVHPEDRDFVVSGVLAALKGGSWDEKYRILRPDGSLRWVWDRSYPVRDSSGRIYRFVGITQDITERRQSEDEINRLNLDLERRVAMRTAELDRLNQELALRNREVERMNRMKSEFLARMSHELRTPLNAIIGFSDLLAEEHAIDGNKRHSRFIGHIQAGAQHLLHMINDILDVSKIEAGRVELRIEQFAAAEAVDEVLSIIKPLATSKKIRMGRSLGADLNLTADRVRFKQILYNLLSNAVKFTPDCGEIEIGSSWDDGLISISVRDTGIGIAVGEQEAIFDEFHQVGIPAGGAAEGTGLGLAITKRLVELHGGKIWVESKPLQGSRFVFTLPNRVAQGMPCAVVCEGDPGI